ncbi:MAG TPA: hypothetical protein VKS78_17045 [Roseiarcus sp.]|nr:hypothetical protein [Roseiarcus sp.]
MPLYFYLLQFVAGLLLANGVPHFVHGISGAPFQTPFAKPRGVGESSPLVNVLWGFVNLAIGLALLLNFTPAGDEALLGWLLIGAGALLMAVFLSTHFSRVRAKK